MTATPNLGALGSGVNPPLMNAYDVLRDVHHIGSRISGTVLSHGKLVMFKDIPGGHVVLKTASAYRALLPYRNGDIQGAWDD